MRTDLDVREQEEQTREGLLARVHRDLEVISRMQHDLARRREMLQVQATRLRLGVPPRVVLAELSYAAAMDGEQDSA